MKSVCIILYIPDISNISCISFEHMYLFLEKKKALFYVILSSPYFSNLLL